MQKYEYLRDMLIERTGKQPVVVWHSCRGYDYWKKMLTQFPYVAIATTLIKNEGKIWRKHPSMISRFIGEAHAAGCKIHGLGYTNCTTLRNLRFDSVDSTAWLYSRVFSNTTLQKHQFFGAQPSSQYHPGPGHHRVPFRPVGPRGGRQQPLRHQVSQQLERQDDARRRRPEERMLPRLRFSRGEFPRPFRFPPLPRPLQIPVRFPDHRL